MHRNSVVSCLREMFGLFKKVDPSIFLLCFSRNLNDGLNASHQTSMNNTKEIFLFPLSQTQLLVDWRKPEPPVWYFFNLFLFSSSSCCCCKRWPSRWRHWFGFLLVAVVDKSCWQSLDVDFVLLWRTAERIDSPQCIAYTFTLAPAVCVCVYTHWAPYGVYT